MWASWAGDSSQRRSLPVRSHNVSERADRPRAPDGGAANISTPERGGAWGSMMKLATCNEPWRDLPVEQVCEIAAQLGFDGVEIAPFTLAADVTDIPVSRRRSVSQAAADAGVKIVGLHWLFVSPPGLHLTTPDRAVRDRSVDYLKRLADLCRDLGGGVMVFGSPKQRSFEPPVTAAEAWKRAREVWASCADHLAERDVTLCIEALSPKETNFINTLDEAVQMADEIGHPHVDIMLDCKAMSAMPGGVVDTIKRFGARARHFHANEPAGKGVGMAVDPQEPAGLDFTDVIRELRASGYDRWVSVEPFDYLPDPTTVAATAIRVLREAMKAVQ